MKMNIRKRYEMIMSQEELEVLMMICSPEEYAYGYRCISESEEEWLVETEDEDLIEEIADELHRYICNLDVDIELDERIISNIEWAIYEVAKEIWSAMQN